MRIRGVHRYSFRRDEWATVTCTESFTPPGHDARFVYKIKYSDGFIDRIPVEDNECYEVDNGTCK